jgi:hypothetical protein
VQLFCLAPLPFALGVFSATGKGVYMRLDVFYAWRVLAGFVSGRALVMFFVYFCVASILQRRRQRTGRRRSRLSGYAVALGLAFMQLVRVFCQPDVGYLVDAKQDADQDEDDSGDPETPEGRLKHFHRQLGRIRRGEPIERLELRM